ncbi:MAG: o-succinylbenzoate--CoA ligase [Desulfobacteraceae bacterium]|jgi:non-ribosomal peptide synthetase component E (peptide arylation enzyme)|nr:MAG: o-succinylbenzoate--CoA ligase [Desulfobacteraceae bacterium]
MGTVARYSPKAIAEYVQKGYWTEQLTVDFWEQNAIARPSQEAIVDSQFRLTWSESVAMVHRLASMLLQLGLKKDSALICQLFNSAAMTLFRLACEKAGVLAVIVSSKFQETELGAVLSATQAAGAVFPPAYGNYDFHRVYEKLQKSHPHLKHLFVADQDAPPGAHALYKIFLTLPDGSLKAEGLNRQTFTPFEFTEITTTSGSTGTPKCAEWTACARLCTARQYIRRFELTAEDVIAAVSPAISGSAETLIHRTPAQVGAKTVMLEHFTPEETLSIIERERVTAIGAVPTHLVRLLSYPHLKKHNISSLRFILVSGGLLPYHLGLEAEEKLGCKILQGYGGMDVGAVASGSLSDPREARLNSVGKILDGNRVILLDPQSGQTIEGGKPGIVTVDGPHCVGGYFRNPEATREAQTGGRFNMGDLGILDGEGFLYLTGRVKDIIIRGGQTIYPKEIEELLVQHRKVLEVALVRMSDAEMGERACAFVVPKAGETFTFEEMTSFFKERQIAHFKIPERLEVVSELPLVPGGNKVNKRELEDELKSRLGTG